MGSRSILDPKCRYFFHLMTPPWPQCLSQAEEEEWRKSCSQICRLIPPPSEFPCRSAFVRLPLRISRNFYLTWLENRAGSRTDCHSGRRRRGRVFVAHIQRNSRPASAALLCSVNGRIVPNLHIQGRLLARKKEREHLRGESEGGISRSLKERGSHSQSSVRSCKFALGEGN